MAHATVKPHAARRERAIAFAVAAVLMALLAVSVIGSLRQLDRSFCGFSVMEGLLVTPFSPGQWSGPASGVKPLDVVLAADGEPLRDLKHLRAIVAAKAPGESIRYRLQRFGGEELALDVPVMELSARDVWSFLFPIALTGAAYILIGLIVYVFIPGTMLGRLFFAGSTLMGLTTGLDYDFATAGTWARLWMITGPIAVAAGGHLCLHYPERSPLLEKRPWLSLIPYPVPLLFALGFQVMLSHAQAMTYLIGAYANYVTLTLFLQGGVVFHTYRKTHSPIARQRVRILLVPFLIMLALMVFGALAALSIDLWIPIQYVAVASMVFPAVLGYGLVTSNLFETESWVRRTAGYFVFTTVVVGIYALVLLVLERALAAQLPAGAERNLPGASALVVLLLLTPLWRFVQDGIDRIFYRRRADLGRELSALSEKLSHTFRVEEIDGRLADGLESALSPEAVAVFRSDEGEGYVACAHRGEALTAIEGLARALATVLRRDQQFFLAGDPALEDAARELLETSALAAVIPIRIAGKPVGAFALSPAKTGRAYSAAELEFASLLASQAAISYDNARLLEAEKNRERIIQQESLGAIAQLVNGAAHEIRNPLASAHSLLQSALESAQELKSIEAAAEAGEDIREAISITQRQHERIRSIVKTLEELSELSAQGREAVPLGKVLDDALGAMRERYSAQTFEIEDERAGEITGFHGSYAQLSQLFENVLDNAVQALPGVGGVVRTSLQAENGFVEFRCADNGCGIPTESLREVFRPFFTTRHSTSSARGLGLYICHEIVRTHGGEIQIESEADQGTRVCIRLPLATS